MKQHYPSEGSCPNTRNITKPQNVLQCAAIIIVSCPPTIHTRAIRKPLLKHSCCCSTQHKGKSSMHVFAGITRIPVALGATALQPATGPGWACGILQEQLEDGSLMTDFGLSADCIAGSHTSISGFHAKVCFSGSTMHNVQYLCLNQLHAEGKGRHPEAIPCHLIDCGHSRVTKAASMTNPGLKASPV